MFNSLKTDEGVTFVLLVLAAKQKKPIVAKADIRDEKANMLLRKSEIWVKVGTGLRQANSEDLHAMIQEGIEVEAELKAKTRFALLRDEIIAAYQLTQSAGRRPPTKELIYGRDESFRLSVQEIILSHDQPRFEMLVEVLRDLLIEGWNRLDAFSSGAVSNVEALNAEALDYKQNHFLPAMRRLVELALLLIKHNVTKDWFVFARDLLAETFETAHRLLRLDVPIETTLSPHKIEEYAGQAIPAIEALIGARAVAAYALKRERFSYLAPLLKQYVRSFGASQKTLQPILFWPLRMSFEIPDGLISFCWEKRVHSAWGDYFGNREAFIAAACKLEFVAEMNSYLGVGYGGKEAAKWFTEHRPNVSLAYNPDLWRYSLSLIIPLAERLYDALLRVDSRADRRESSFGDHVECCSRTPVFPGWLSRPSTKDAGRELEGKGSLF